MGGFWLQQEGVGALQMDGWEGIIAECLAQACSLLVLNVEAGCWTGFYHVRRLNKAADKGLQWKLLWNSPAEGDYGRKPC